MIAAIEDAIINAIKAASDAQPGLGYRLREVASYGGQLDDDLANVVRGFPAVWVAYAGAGKSRPHESQRRKWKTPLTFALMHGTRNVRGERATRHGLEVAGSIKEVGVYQMLDDTRAIMLGNDFGLPIRRFAPGGVKTLFNTRLNNQGLAVFVREWHTEIIEEAPREAFDSTSGDFLKVGIDYFLQPDDGTADVSSEIELKA